MIRVFAAVRFTLNFTIVDLKLRRVPSKRKMFIHPNEKSKSN